MTTLGNRNIGSVRDRLVAAGKGLKPFAAGVATVSLMAVSTTALGYDYAETPLFWSTGVQPNVMVLVDTSGSMDTLVANESFNRAKQTGTLSSQKWYFCKAYNNVSKKCVGKYTTAIADFDYYAWRSDYASQSTVQDYVSGNNYALCNVKVAPGSATFYIGVEGSSWINKPASIDDVGVLVSDNTTTDGGTKDSCVRWRPANTQRVKNTAVAAGRDGNNTSLTDPVISTALSEYATHLLNTLVFPDGGKKSYNFDSSAYPIADSDPDNFDPTVDNKVIPGVTRMEAAREVSQKVVMDNYDKMQIGLSRFDSTLVRGCNATKTSGVFDAEAHKTVLIGAKTDMSLVPDSSNDGDFGGLVASGGTPLSKSMNAVNNYFNGSSSPIAYRCQKNYTIVMTDGDPSSDETSSTLDKRAQQGYDTDFKPDGTATDSGGGSWNDTSDPEWVKQNNVTYTIGFGLENDLLKRTPLVDRKTITGTGITDNTIPLNNHGLQTGDLIEVVTGNGLITSNIATASASPSESGKYYYYVARVNGNSFKLSNTKAKARTCAGGTDTDCSAITSGTDMTLSIGPGKSYFAFTPDGLATALNSAFSSIRNLTASSSSVSASSKNVGAGGQYVYQADFSTVDWGGTVKAFPVGTDGVVSNTATWTTSSTLDTPAERTNLLTWRNDTNVAVDLSSGTAATAYGRLSLAQQSYISNTATAGTTPAGDATKGANTIEWLRGNTPAGTRAHPVTGLLGDVINSDPLFVGALNYGYHKLPPSASSCTPAVPTSGGSGCTGAETYSNYVSGSRTRTQMLYVGSNDGMMHAFTANGLNESMAYIPSAVYQQWFDNGRGCTPTSTCADNNTKEAGEVENKLFSLTQPSYLGNNQHHFFVDGSTTVGDVFLGNSWKTYLVGTLGAGGRGVYAIDISNPGSLNTGAVMWDYNYQTVIGSDSTTAPKLGYTLGKPVIGRLGDNNWYAFIPNGTDSNDDKARVFVIRLGDAATSLNVRTLEVTDGASKTAPNGMMTIQARVDSARTVKTIYGGDMRGNIWKFDLSGITSGSSSWPGTVAAPLFTATTTGAPGAANRQAITGGMRLGEYPNTTKTIVFFGTGKYFEKSDKTFDASTSTPLFDSFYAVLDDGATSGMDKGSLTMQEFVTSGTNTRTATVKPWDNSKKGWYIDLKLGATAANGGGERVLTTPLLYGGRIIFVSMFPGAQDPCTATGTSWLNELDALSGSQIAEDGHGILDTNGNGVIDSGDAQIASIKVDGMASDPSVVQNAAGQEFKVMGSTSRATPIRSIAESTPPGVGLPGGAGRMSWTQLQ